MIVLQNLHTWMHNLYQYVKTVELYKTISLLNTFNQMSLKYKETYSNLKGSDVGFVTVLKVQPNSQYDTRSRRKNGWKE